MVVLLCEEQAKLKCGNPLIIYRSLPPLGCQARAGVSNPVLKVSEVKGRALKHDDMGGGPWATEYAWTPII